MHKVLFVDLKPHSDWEIDWNGLGLSLGGYADTVSAAMSLLDNDIHAIVVIHLYRADADGIELCKQIRSVSTVPIVLIGGSTDFHWARKALQYQVSDYLPAPFTADELNASLQSIMLKPGSHLPAAAEDEAPQQENVIEKVKGFVEEALHQNITLKEISQIMHFNCSYLGQKFKYQENMTFNEYLLQQRMEKAKTLLEHTNMKIYEIANKVGYTEIDWFYKKFKSYTGVSANEYRKMRSITA